MISCAFNVPVDCLSNILISFLFDFLFQLSLLLSGAIYSCGQTSTSEIIFGNYALWAQFPVFSAFCHLLNLFSDFPEASSPLNFLCVQVRDILPGITLSHTDTVVGHFQWVLSILSSLAPLFSPTCPADPQLWVNDTAHFPGPAEMLESYEFVLFVLLLMHELYPQGCVLFSLAVPLLACSWFLFYFTRMTVLSKSLPCFDKLKFTSYIHMEIPYSSQVIRKKENQHIDSVVSFFYSDKSKISKFSTPSPVSQPHLSSQSPASVLFFQIPNTPGSFLAWGSCLCSSLCETGFLPRCLICIQFWNLTCISLPRRNFPRPSICLNIDWTPFERINSGESNSSKSKDQSASLGASRCSKYFIRLYSLPGSPCGLNRWVSKVTPILDMRKLKQEW